MIASLLASPHASALIIMLNKRVPAHRWRAWVCGYMIGVFFTAGALASSRTYHTDHAHTSDVEKHAREPSTRQEPKYHRPPRPEFTVILHRGSARPTQSAHGELLGEIVNQGSFFLLPHHHIMKKVTSERGLCEAPHMRPRYATTLILFVTDTYVGKLVRNTHGCILASRWSRTQTLHF